MSLPIPRGGVITGQVLDDFGDPAFGAQVRALRYVMRTGRAHACRPRAAARTDDRGIYRIPALLPGEYIVVVTPREGGMMVAEEMKVREMMLDGRGREAGGGGRRVATGAGRRRCATRWPGTTPAPDAPMYAPVYYPGTTQARSATTVTLDVSEERAGIDLRLQLVPTVTVIGQVDCPMAPLPPGAQVQMVDLDQPVPGMNVRSARVQADGRFSFSARAAWPIHGLRPRDADDDAEGPAAPAIGRGAWPSRSTRCARWRRRRRTSATRGRPTRSGP